MSKLEVGFKKATGSLMTNLFSKKAASSTQENALSAQPLLSERGLSLALRETRRTQNQANINSAMPRLAAFGDHKAFGSNNKREAKQLLKENKVKEVQLRKYPQIQPSKSKYLFLFEGPRCL